MSKTWNYVAGDWWAICDVCGQKHKASRMKKRWDGLMVCEEDFEQRHSQDFVKAKIDKIVVPWTRPRSTDNFVEVSYINNYFVQGYIDNDYVGDIDL